MLERNPSTVLKELQFLGQISQQDIFFAPSRWCVFIPAFTGSLTIVFDSDSKARKSDVHEPCLLCIHLYDLARKNMFYQGLTQVDFRST